MKIGGAPLPDDLRRIEAVLTILKTPNQLAVDANGRFNLDTADRLCKGSLLRMGFAGTKKRAIPWTTICKLNWRLTTPAPWPPERIYSPCKMRAILSATRACGPDRDVLQFDCALSYGLVEYLRILQM